MHRFPESTPVTVAPTQHVLRVLLDFNHPFHVAEALVHQVLADQLAPELVSQHLEEGWRLLRCLLLLVDLLLVDCLLRVVAPMALASDFDVSNGQVGVLLLLWLQSQHIVRIG